MSVIRKDDKCFADRNIRGYIGKYLVWWEANLQSLCIYSYMYCWKQGKLLQVNV